MSKLLIALLVFPIVAEAEPIDPLKPMAFLAGRCWKGTFPDAKQTDTHCFEWMFGGKALRDIHTVRSDARPDYIGETIYYFDSIKKRVEYLYVENLGGVSRGAMESAPGALLFPAAQYIEGEKGMTYRSRWTKLDDVSYEVFSEMQDKDSWAPMFKLTMRRVDP